MHTEQDKEEMKMRSATMGLLVVILVFSYLFIHHEVYKDKQKDNLTSFVETNKVDSMFVHYDSLEHKCIGSDYYFYYDSSTISIFTSTVSPFKQAADTQLYVRHKNNNKILYLVKEYNREVVNYLLKKQLYEWKKRN